jgi:DNA repair protein RecO (recombination protein O)
MFRNQRLDALVLKTQRIGEMHRLVTLFNPVEGIIRATAYGAFKTKGRLRSDTESFNYIKAYLYLEPVKNNYKITDSECLLSFPGLRQSVERLYTASLCAEIVLKSFGGGESKARVFTLILESLKQINQSSEDSLSYISIQFIWRFLDITGFNLDINTCGLCHNTLDSTQPFYFLLNSAFFVCKKCCKSSRLELSPGVRSYFNKTEKLPLSKAIKITMQTETMHSLKIVLYTCIQTLLNTELVSLQTGEGIV